MKRILSILFAMLLCLIMCIISFFLGVIYSEKTSSSKKTDTGINGNTITEESGTTKSYDEIEAFYATVEDVSDSIVSVKGLDINDINSRGDFEFEIRDKVEIIWRGEKKIVSDLKKGQIILILYSGEILESDPACIENVLKVEILND